MTIPDLSLVKSGFGVCCSSSRLAIYVERSVGK
uniref:Uncharacterized protein n=1 Tax=Myoviridae sp. ctLnO19 TaxID=2825085 RepID=A0A8S5NZM4_9CAUD|nr:MAG TPA: hypothetical protein [Myoviridae sp. ctLnO19]DAJ69036.1 MAG TPA: hypothetical protein [Caudoviricetes sp.]DAK20192.1 MAG TPA: hypothetical protein [Caudoviricetes sp.]DAQ70157.1 MAG TPA: hypothetical protein [Caudoviricetes sp.]DAY09947.1 MAG TPA: hypothetical protein [Caudoviricetes sp.]